MKKINCLPEKYKFIHSINISKIFNILDIKCIEELNIERIEVFKELNENFYNDLILELNLRGFNDDLDYNYLNISFEEFGLGDIIDRFKINSDMFFNYIPINNFQYLNNEIDIEEFENCLRNNGFKLIVFKNEQLLKDDRIMKFFENKNMKSLSDISKLSKIELLLRTELELDEIEELDEYLRENFNICLKTGVEINNDIKLELFNFSESFTKFINRRNDIWLKDISEMDLVDLLKYNCITIDDIKKIMDYSEGKSLLENIDNMLEKNNLNTINKEADVNVIDNVSKEKWDLDIDNLLKSLNIMHLFEYFEKINVKKIDDVFCINKNLLLLENYSIKDIYKIEEYLFNKYRRSLSTKNNFKRNIKFCNMYVSDSFTKYYLRSQYIFLKELEYMDFVHLVDVGYLSISDVRTIFEYGNGNKEEYFDIRTLSINEKIQNVLEIKEIKKIEDLERIRINDFLNNYGIHHFDIEQFVDDMKIKYDISINMDKSENETDIVENITLNVEDNKYSWDYESFLKDFLEKNKINIHEISIFNKNMLLLNAENNIDDIILVEEIANDILKTKLSKNNNFNNDYEIDDLLLSKVFKEHCKTWNVCTLQQLNDCDFTGLIVAGKMTRKDVKRIFDYDNWKICIDDYKINGIVLCEEDYIKIQELMKKCNVKNVEALSKLCKTRLWLKRKASVTIISEIDEILKEKFDISFSNYNDFVKKDWLIENMDISKNFIEYCNINNVTILGELDNIDFIEEIVQQRLDVDEVYNIFRYGDGKKKEQREISYFNKNETDIQTNISKCNREMLETDFLENDKIDFMKMFADN